MDKFIISRTLSTVRLPARHIGQTAAKALVDQLQRRHAIDINNIVIDSELMIRQSTRACS